MSPYFHHEQDDFGDVLVFLLVFAFVVFLCLAFHIRL